MKLGFIGAGKAGCSMGKYLETKSHQVEVVGYYSLVEEEAMWAARFTNSQCFQRIEELVKASDSIMISTPDGAIKHVWDSLDKDTISGKTVCHLSGSLSSDVFSKCGEYGAYPISIHPMFAFSDKESVYQQLNHACFTLEGCEQAVLLWKSIFDDLGNRNVCIDKSEKVKYHAAASLLSNHIVAVLQTGYELLQACGFSESDARSFSEVLVKENVSHVITQGGKDALTGPIERGDLETVKKHLDVLNIQQRNIYNACGSKLIEIAKEKNPKREYQALEELLKKEN